MTFIIELTALQNLVISGNRFISFCVQLQTVCKTSLSTL